MYRFEIKLNHITNIFPFETISRLIRRLSFFNVTIPFKHVSPFGRTSDKYICHKELNHVYWRTNFLLEGLSMEIQNVNDVVNCCVIL